MIVCQMIIGSKENIHLAAMQQYFVVPSAVHVHICRGKASHRNCVDLNMRTTLLNKVILNVTRPDQYIHFHDYIMQSG